MFIDKTRIIKDDVIIWRKPNWIKDIPGVLQDPVYVPYEFVYVAIPTGKTIGGGFRKCERPVERIDVPTGYDLYMKGITFNWETLSDEEISNLVR